MIIRIYRTQNAIYGIHTYDTVLESALGHYIETDEFKMRVAITQRAGSTWGGADRCHSAPALPNLMESLRNGVVFSR